MGCLTIPQAYGIVPRLIVPDKNLIYAGGDDLPLRTLSHNTAEELQDLPALRRYIEADLDEIEDKKYFWFSLHLILVRSRLITRGSIRARIM